MSLIIKTCINNWLKVALDATKDPLKVGRMLTIKEFIQFTDFMIDKYSMDKFYYNLSNDIPIYLDNSLIEWFGYKGKLLVQKEKIKNILQNNFAEYKDIYWFEYSNKEYSKFYDENSISLVSDIENNSKNDQLNHENHHPNPELPDLNMYPNPTEFNGKNKTKHMIIHPTIFKHIVLMADTDKSMEIRNYYIMLEDLIKKYTQYQSETLKTINMSLENKINQMLVKMEKNDIKANEDRLKSEDRFNALMNKTSDISEKLIKSEEKADNHRKKLDVILPNAVKDKDININKLEYLTVLYVPKRVSKRRFRIIRGQKSYNQSVINEVKSEFRSTECILNIKVPNAMKFWESIIINSEIILGNDSKITKWKGQWYGSQNITKQDLLHVITNVREIWTKDENYPIDSDISD